MYLQVNPGEHVPITIQGSVRNFVCEAGLAS
jgi:hypothetical protein